VEAPGGLSGGDAPAADHSPRRRRRARAPPLRNLLWTSAIDRARHRDAVARKARYQGPGPSVKRRGDVSRASVGGRPRSRRGQAHTGAVDRGAADGAVLGGDEAQHAGDAGNGEHGGGGIGRARDLLLVAAPAWAQFKLGSQRAGTSSGSFLKIGIGARAIGLGDRVGTLAPGRRADLVVWDRDLTRIPPQQLLEAKLVMSVVAGVEAKLR